MIKLRNKMNIYILDDGLPYFIELPDGSVVPTSMDSFCLSSFESN